MHGADSGLVDRVGSTGFIQLQAESFHALTPREQALAYWLSEAAIAIDPIIYDQNSRFGLRQKHLLETIVAQRPASVPGGVMEQIVNFTKLFWANRGNHNDMTAQKFLPEFAYEDLKQAAGAVGLGVEAEQLRASLFDANFEPTMTVKNPRAGLDILQASANNFYSGLSLADLKDFQEKYPLNSRLAKRGGRLVEDVYRAGTPDGKVKPGLYAEYLRRANHFLEKARAYATPGQSAAIEHLIRFYQTGEPQEWLQFGVDWVQTNPRVDFDNGFIEVYRDARGAKGTSQAFVTVTDEKLDSMMHKIADNAQYFEDRAPWKAEYKKQGVKPPLAKAVEALIETGDFHVNTTGDNLPNENEIHEKYGTKSFIFTGSTRAFARATGTAALKEFAATPGEVVICAKNQDEAEDLITALHEVIGHGSGRLDPKLTHEPSYYLKEYFSTLEEARADLMALWNVWDPKLKELGVISGPDVARAMYYAAIRVALTQLRRIPHGDTIEEDHQRGRQLIASYVMDKTSAVKREERGGKTYYNLSDFDEMRKGVGMLLAELMRIKAEGDYGAIKALVDKYGVHFDPKLRDQVERRYHSLNLPAYWAGINPDLTARFGPDGRITSVAISYPRDFVKQQLHYSAMYSRQRISTIAGDGAAGFSARQVNNPYGLTIGPDGALYFCEVDNHRVRRLDLKSGTLSVAAGSGENGYAGDGGPAAKASLNQPYEVRFDRSGNMYFVEMQNHVVRRVDRKTGIITTVAGTGTPGFAGDGGPANRAQLRQPHSIAFDPAGGLLICDIGNRRIRRVNLESGIIETWAGTGEAAPTPDGAPLKGTPLNGPRAIDSDPSGNLYLVLREGNAVYRIDTRAGRIYHFAGTGEKGYTGDGGPAREARFSGPKGISWAPDGGVYIADTENHAIRRIDLRSGKIATVAGTGERGDGPDGDPLRCRLSRPHGIFAAKDGAVYVGDSESHRVRLLQ